MEIGGSSSSKGFGEESEDALIEILSRLPVKSLCRFMCVSNAWYALIKNPSLTDLHQNFSLVLKQKTVKTNKVVGGHGKEFAVSLVDDELKHKSLELPLLQGRFESAEVVGCSNGLVCLHLSEDYYDRNKYKIVVWNPATKHHKILPKTNKKQFEVLGFEYFRDMRDYKVVSIFYEIELEGFRVKFFTRSTNCWTELETCFECFPTPEYGLHSYQDYRTVNGVMYLRFDVGRGYLNRNYILSFDLRDEVLQITQVPPENSHRIGRLLSWKGSLAFVVYDATKRSEDRVELLTISTGRPRANKQLQVEHRWSISMASYPYLILKDEYLLAKNYGNPDEQYILYNLRSHEVMKTELPKHEWPSEYEYLTAHNYTASLVSVGIV